MPLSPGEQFGPYTLVSPLGEGGMGEVWKARDTRLDRTVALKMSKASFTERFGREARAVAALNHPNICTLHDVGPNYLVMEFIEGESPKGALPLEIALGYARQIADALEAAHEKGIVHRDLKPANIKIKPDGTVKVLDFGLAKTIETPSGDPQSSPTQTISATRAGMILGTAAYMSPEQARGRKVDKRADIWAFGVVLYEMLTGRMLFEGEDLTETLASVMKDTPDLSAAPAPVRRLLESCLQKEPKKRLRDIGDAWRLLEAPSIPAGVPKHGRTWPWAAAALLAAVAALVGWLRPDTAEKERLAMTLSIVPPSGIALREFGNMMSAPEISPDGSAVLYQSADFHIYVRRLDSLEPRLVPGRAGTTPFWSADSTAVLYPTSSAQLTKVRLPDGAPEAIAKLNNAPRGGSSSEAGAILLSAYPGCLSVIAAPGGEVKPVEMPGPLKEGRCYYPEFLPGGQSFLFLFVPNNDPSDPAVYLASLRDGKAVDPALLLKNETAARYTPAGGGRILFVRNDNLYSQKLKGARKLEGEAELVAQGVVSQPSMATHHGDFSVARNGTVAWRPGRAPASQVTEFDRNGNQLGTSGPPGSYSNLVLSPDERQLLVSSSESGWLVDLGQSGRSELPKGVLWTGWFAGASKLIGIRDGALAEVSASGSGEVRELRKIALSFSNSISISADGKQVVANTNRGFVSMRVDGTAEEMKPKVVVEQGAQANRAGLSPDCRWLVYETRDSGGGLYVQPFAGPGQRRQIAPGGATSPVWRKDGKEILYASGDALMSVAVEWNGTLKFGAPRKLFSGLRLPVGSSSSRLPLAVSHDGSRIFWAQGIDQPESNLIHVKTGWWKQ
jgi:serine/threonine protein kinase